MQLLMVACWLCWLRSVYPLGSMNSMAASYGENGQTLCRLRPEKANVATCFGSDVASVYGAPPRLPLVGLTGEIDRALLIFFARTTIIARVSCCSCVH